MRIPEAKLPNLNLPAIRNLPTIPHVGCAPGDPNSFVGEQFGNAPDLNSILSIRALIKSLEEQIYALIQGKLSDAMRPIPYDARAIQLTNEVAELVTAMTTIINGVVGSVNAAIEYANQQLTAVNQALSAIAAVPAAARSAVQKLLFERYSRYAQELNAQVGRMEASLACIG